MHGLFILLWDVRYVFRLTRTPPQSPRMCACSGAGETPAEGLILGQLGMVLHGRLCLIVSCADASTAVCVSVQVGCLCTQLYACGCRSAACVCYSYT